METSCGDDDDGGAGCVFAKALLHRSAVCENAERHDLGERLQLRCRSPVAQTNCRTLLRLGHERARFALRLPGDERRPLTHLQALRLQCGTLAALQQVLDSDRRDAHRLVLLAHDRHGSLAELPWDRLVATLAAWQPPPRRSRGDTP